MYLNESVNVYEMANIRKKTSLLPVNIWVDENKNYLSGRHGKRIKYQLNYADSVQNSNLGTMTLDGEVVEKSLLHKENDLKSKAIKCIQNFVKNNDYALDLLSDAKIDLETFYDVLIPGGDLVSDEEKNIQIDKINDSDWNLNENIDYNNNGDIMLLDDELYDAFYDYDGWMNVDYSDIDDELQTLYDTVLYTKNNIDVFNSFIEDSNETFSETGDAFYTIDNLYENCVIFCIDALKDYIENESPLDDVDINHLAEILMKDIARVG